MLLSSCRPFIETFIMRADRNLSILSRGKFGQAVGRLPEEPQSPEVWEDPR